MLRARIKERAYEGSLFRPRQHPHIDLPEGDALLKVSEYLLFLEDFAGEDIDGGFTPLLKDVYGYVGLLDHDDPCPTGVLRVAFDNNGAGQYLHSYLGWKL